MKNHFDVRGEVTVIFLNDGVESLIDTSMLSKVLEYPNTWYSHMPTDKAYVCGWLKGKPQRLHRWLTDAPKGFMVDHINGNTLDNRIDNLRIVNNSQNQQNRMGAQRNSTSGIRGVSWNKQRRKWTAHLKVSNKKIYLGIYSDIKEAERVVTEARQKYMTHSAS